MKVAFKITPNIVDVANTGLSIEVCDDEITFFIHTKNDFSIIGFYSFQFEKYINSAEYANAIKNIVENETELQQTFASVKVFYNTATCTLIPTTYFKETEKENLLSLMFGPLDDVNIFQENLVNIDAKTAYAVPNKIYDSINNFFVQNTFHHSTSKQIQNNVNSSDQLHCMVYNSFIKIILYKNANLQLVQFFDYTNPEDVSYYLLQICKQFFIELSTLHIILSGAIVEQSNLYENIYRYFLNISFAELPADINIATELHHLPKHFFAQLTALSL